MGSILRKDFQKVNDVDIIIRFKENFVDFQLSITLLDFIRKEFYSIFGKRLHITIFTYRESLEFDRFLKVNIYETLI